MNNVSKNVPIQDEAQKLRTKVSKVISYWKRQSLLIPNVFRLAREIDGDALHLLEHQDLSRKELLVQSNGMKAKSSSIYCDSENEGENVIDNDVSTPAPIIKTIPKKQRTSKT